MIFIGLWPEEPLCELGVLFAGEDVESFAGAVIGVGLIGCKGSVFALLEE